MASYLMGWVYKNGAILLPGSSRVTPATWDDLKVPMSAVKIQAADKPPDFEEFIAGSDLYTYAFDGADDEQVFFVIQVNHNYKFGTDLHCHVHWSPTTNDAGNVQWCLSFTVAEIGGTFSSPAAATCATGAAGGTAWTHNITELVEIDGSAIDSVSSMGVMRLYRFGSDPADTYNAHDAALLEFDCHYQIDSWGSDTEYTKT